MTAKSFPIEIEMMQKYNLPLVVIGHEMAGEKLGSITLDYETTLLSILENYYDKVISGMQIR